MNLDQEKSDIWDKMNLEGEEILFAREVLQEMSNRGVRRFPFKTGEYYRALQRIQEDYQKKGRTPFSIETLFVRTPLHGEFPRMDVAIESCMGTCVWMSPPYEEMKIDLPHREVESPLAKDFAEKFIEELKLQAA